MEQIKPTFESEEERIKRMLTRLEGRSWTELTEGEKRELVELAAIGDLSAETAERLKTLVPRPDEMEPADRALYLKTLERLGLVTKEEIEG
jgi:hypothetical protein